MTSPADLSVTEAGQALRDGSLTAEQLAAAHLARIDERNDAIGAFVHLDPDATRAAARRADQELSAGLDRGPLHGIPVAIKDIFDVAGWPVRYGSRLYADRLAPGDATTVGRLREAGAVLLGLVATYELAIVGPGEDGLYPQPRNPWNLDHITGGSSSGCAAAIAAGMVRIALGSDTGGSVRSPSAYCGIVGLKPTKDALPKEGVLPLAPSLDTPGAMARTVHEARLLHAALAQRPMPEPSLSLQGLRIGIARNRCLSDDLPAITGYTDDAAASLSLCGATLTPLDLPDLDLMIAAAAVLIHAEGLQTHREHLSGDGGRMGRMPYQSMAAGAVLTEQDVANARHAATRLGTKVDAALQDVDAIVMPTTLTTAPAFADFAGGSAKWTPMCTLPFNMTGHPALSVPMGFSDGLPLGLQIVGRPNEEATLLRIGEAFEMSTDHGAPDAFAMTLRAPFAREGSPIATSEEMT